MKHILLLVILLNVTQTSFAQWQEQSCGITTPGRGFSQIVTVSPSKVWATEFDVTGVDKTIQDFIRTPDGGITWIVGTVAAVTASYAWACLSAVAADTAWAALNDSLGTGGEVYKTTDGGAHWEKLDVSSGKFPVRVVYFFNSTQGIVIGDPLNGHFEIFSTDDAGVTWDSIDASKIPIPLPDEEGVNASFEVRGSKFYFGTTKGRFFVTQDKGQNWTANPISDFTGSIDKIISTDNKSFILRQHEEGSDVYSFKRTVDGGVTWIDLLPNGPFYKQNICKVPNTDHTLVSAGWDVDSGIGSSFSNDEGDDWYALDTGVAHTATGFFLNDIGWSGGITSDFSSGGIYKFTGYFFATGIEELNSSDASIRISPNPANTQLIIQFGGPKAVDEILVSDVSGRIFFTQTPGSSNSNNLSVDVSGWGKGIYFVQMKNAYETVTRKIVVNH